VGDWQPLEATEYSAEAPLRLTEAPAIAPQRRLPAPLPEGIEDAPPPAWHRLLLTGFLVLEVAWLGLLAFLLVWLFAL
jgi:hypothetical protein